MLILKTRGGWQKFPKSAIFSLLSDRLATHPALPLALRGPLTRRTGTISRGDDPQRIDYSLRECHRNTRRIRILLHISCLWKHKERESDYFLAILKGRQGHLGPSCQRNVIERHLQGHFESLYVRIYVASCSCKTLTVELTSVVCHNTISNDMNDTVNSLLHAYEKQHAPKTSGTVDRLVRPILIWAIYDLRSAAWVHDFLVNQKCLPELKDSKRTAQVRKVQRWRAAVEREIGLPPRPQGGATPLYQAMRQAWEQTNPRPTLEQLQSGWTAKPVDYSQFYSAPTPSSPPKPAPQSLTQTPVVPVETPPSKPESMVTTPTPKATSVATSSSPDAKSKKEFNIQDLQSMTPEEREAFLLREAFKREDGELVPLHPKAFGVTPEQLKSESERLRRKPTT